MDNKKQSLTKSKKANQKTKVSKKFKIISGIILLTELLFAFRGNRLYGVLLFMITSAAILILLDKENPESLEDSEDDKFNQIKSSIHKEIELINKSTKKLKYDLSSKNKLNDIKEHLASLNEKYLFIKDNYGEERGMNTLDEIMNQLKKLENNLKEINDKLLNFYISKDEDKNLNEDLDFIIDQLNAHKSLNKQ